MRAMGIGLGLRERPRQVPPPPPPLSPLRENGAPDSRANGQGGCGRLAHTGGQRANHPPAAALSHPPLSAPPPPLPHARRRPASHRPRGGGGRCPFTRWPRSDAWLARRSAPRSLPIPPSPARACVASGRSHTRAGEARFVAGSQRSSAIPLKGKLGGCFGYRGLEGGKSGDGTRHTFFLPHKKGDINARGSKL